MIKKKLMLETEFGDRDKQVYSRCLCANEGRVALSFSRPNAIAIQAKYACQSRHHRNGNCVDAAARGIGGVRPAIDDVQLEAASNANFRPDGLRLIINRKNYNRLLSERILPLILVAIGLPFVPSRRSICSIEKLALRRQCWWTSVVQSHQIEQESKTVIIPEPQRLDPPTLEILMDSRRWIP